MLSKENTEVEKYLLENKIIVNHKQVIIFIYLGYFNFFVLN